MTLPVVWLQEAREEYYAALQWYADISPPLARRYAQAVEDAVQIISEFPLRYPLHNKDRRRAGVRRFPYGLFYVIENSRVVVLACFHGRRSPQGWRQRSKHLT